MSYLLQIVETEKQPVLSVKTTTSVSNMPNVVGRAYSSIVNYIMEKGEEPVGPAFIAYYNMDMENLNVEIGFPVTKEIEGKDDIVLRYIPAGKKATGFHKGSYGEIGPVYEQLTKFISEKGYKPTGVTYEYYYNAPDEIPESELLTKIEFLLE
ncbi:MAG TPA: GyrI-like domain-containing protein [Sedimentibacter sp.]|nr:GyrI-like domain-containing protein [Sedimentibacter sp.]HNZ82749.1 GyrI-like domain-containing protein [Sedimentibacter sp.]HQB62944.1 GyrI-like domain-containing protein [Sedimentibacter sp.]